MYQKLHAVSNSTVVYQYEPHIAAYQRYYNHSSYKESSFNTTNRQFGDGHMTDKYGHCVIAIATFELNVTLLDRGHCNLAFRQISASHIEESLMHQRSPEDGTTILFRLESAEQNRAQAK